MKNSFWSKGITRHFVHSLLLTLALALFTGGSFAQVPTGTPPV